MRIDFAGLLSLLCLGFRRPCCEHRKWKVLEALTTFGGFFFRYTYTYIVNPLLVDLLSPRLQAITGSPVGPRNTEYSELSTRAT